MSFGIDKAVPVHAVIVDDIVNDVNDIDIAVNS